MTDHPPASPEEPTPPWYVCVNCGTRQSHHERYPTCVSCLGVGYLTLEGPTTVDPLHLPPGLTFRPASSPDPSFPPRTNATIDPDPREGYCSAEEIAYEDRKRVGTITNLAVISQSAPTSSQTRSTAPMPDTPLIPPALTPEQWAVALAPSALTREGECEGDRIVRWALDEVIEDTDRHGLAALCLHGQPGGFTHEDVAALLEDGHPEYDCFHPGQLCCDPVARQARRRSIAARLAALLPPSSPESHAPQA